MRRSLPPAAAALLTFSSLGLLSASASAQSIIKNPGDHVSSVELEPHLILVPWGTPGDDFGWGLGFRATIPIVDNGFVSTINNSVGIGFGVDWMRYGLCSGYYRDYYRAYGYDCGSVNRFMFPVVMQWNFFLAKSWSVFGEPGLAFDYYSYSCPNVPLYDRFGRVYGYADTCFYGSHTHLDFVMFGGARWHFSQYTTLTFRVGFAGLGDYGNGYFSIGVSFL